MKVHVTGGSGFLGGHVVPMLVAQGYEVTGLARSSIASRRLAELGSTPIGGDLDDPGSITAAFLESGAVALVNLASLGFGHAADIVAAAEKAEFGRAVFVSTTAIFTSLDARSKSVRQAAEDRIRDSSLAWTILRPTMIYGTTADRNMARLVRFLRRTPVVPLPGGGAGLQQPVHVDDVAAAVVAALTCPAAVGRSYDIAGPEALSLRAVVEATASAVGRSVRIVPVPLAATVAAARLSERVLGRSHIRAEQLERLAEDKAFDVGPAHRDLGYNPRPFTVGIRQEAASFA